MVQYSLNYMGLNIQLISHKGCGTAPKIMDRPCLHIRQSLIKLLLSIAPLIEACGTKYEHPMLRPLLKYRPCLLRQRQSMFAAVLYPCGTQTNQTLIKINLDPLQ